MSWGRWKPRNPSWVSGVEDTEKELSFGYLGMREVSDTQTPTDALVKMGRREPISLGLKPVREAGRVGCLSGLGKRINP